MSRVPWLTISICLVAGIVHAMPALGEALILDRAAIAGGEAWRLVTGNLVHVSAAHLVWDVLALGIPSALVERRGRCGLSLLLGGAMAAVGVSVIAFAPELARYAGLSGVACAVTMHVALGGAGDAGGERRAMRFARLALVLALVLKLLAESASGRPVLLDTEAGIVVAPIAHLAGAAVGAALALVAVGVRAARGVSSGENAADADRAAAVPAA